MATNSYTIEVKGKKPFVVLLLKQYEALLEYIEELEDKADLKERANDAIISWTEVKKEIKKKVSVK